MQKRRVSACAFCVRRKTVRSCSIMTNFLDNLKVKDVHKSQSEMLSQKKLLTTTF